MGESVLTEEHISTASRPSALRITDLRVANLHGVPLRSSIIRLDTNHGLVGYGEVRDQASASYALMLKSRVGFIDVPQTPGLGFGDIDEELFREHLDPRAPELFADPGRRDAEFSHDRLWS